MGAALVFLVPAFQISIYVLVFGSLMQGRLHGNPSIHGYSIYLCSGILFWNFFADLMQRSQNLYLENANLLKKATFPAGVLSIINLTASSINLFLAVGMLFLFLLVTFAFPGWAVLGLLPTWLALAALALSLGLCIAVLQVFFRDFGTLTGIAMQTLFWATPIVYPPEILPQWLQPWLELNPLFAPVSTAQALMLGMPMPGRLAWCSTVLVTILAALLARRLFYRHQTDLLDNL
jgi:lipopolysaccharide transport system permease protein